MKKIVSSLAGLTASMSAMAADKAVLQADYWFAVQPHIINGDVPEVRGMPENAVTVASYFPEAVDTGYVGFLHSSAAIGNWIFASVVLVAIVFALFVMVNGRAKLSNGFSGKLVDRWSAGDVALHWVVALPCLALIATGLFIGAGSEWFAGFMDPESFAAFVRGSVAVHNFFGIPFAIAAVVMMLKWMPRQMPEACDLAWFAKLGGYINIGKTHAEHPDAGFANAGEKAFYWTFVIFGLILIVTGLMMMVPEFFGGVEQNTANMALVLHIIAAIVLGAFSVIHVYMGAVMSEGGMENMISGKCDENWAKQNHNLWYAKVQK